MTNNTTTLEPTTPTVRYGVMTDYDYSDTHTNRRLTMWSGSFCSDFAAEVYSRPNGWTVHPAYGKPFHVDGPNDRTDDNYQQVDALLSAALNAHENGKG
jgi:hypothetical protein